MNATNQDAPERSEIEALLPWHAAGTLSRRDTQRVEDALARDPELARRYALVRDELGESGSDDFVVIRNQDAKHGLHVDLPSYRSMLAQAQRVIRQTNPTLRSGHDRRGSVEQTPAPRLPKVTRYCGRAGMPSC